MKQRFLFVLPIFIVAFTALLVFSWSVSAAVGGMAQTDNGGEGVDLQLHLTSEPRPAVAPGPILYTAVIRSDAADIPITALTLTLDIDPAVIVLDYAVSEGEFNQESGAWDGFILTAFSPLTLTIAGHVDDLAAAGSTALTSTGMVTTTQAYDPFPDNNTSIDVNDLVFVNDLGVQMDSTPTPAVSGEAITYTVVVTSSSPVQTVTQVSLTIALDTTISLEVYQASAGSFDPDTGLWEGFILTPTSPITLTITGLVAPGATGSLHSSALVTSTQVSDPLPDNNLANDENPLVQLADLSVYKTAEPLQAAAGETLTYTITANNHGPSHAVNLVILDRLPTLVDVFFISDPACEEDGGIVTCEWAELGAGQEFEVILAVIVDISASGNLINQVEVSSDTPDPNLDNNEFELTTPIAAAVADVSVSKSGPAVVTAGETLAYILAVANDGPAPAANVVLTDTLPAQTTFVSIDNPNCGSNSGLVICSWDELAVNEEMELSLIVAVAAAARNPLVNQVEVTSATPDLNPANNQDQTTTPVIAIANLSLSKTVAPAIVTGHAPFVYTLTLANDGPSAALATILTDEWPAGLELVSGPTQCTLVASVLTCNLDTVQAGQEVILSLMARAAAVDPANNVIYTNSAVVESDAGQSNQASASVTIRPYRLFLPAIVKPPVWQQVGDLPAGVTAFYDIAFCGDQTLSGASNGIYRLQGNSWQHETSGPGTVVLQLVFAGDSCDRVYAASFGGGIWMGLRSGSTWNWIQINNGLNTARSVIVRDDTLFVAGDFGIYSASIPAHNFVVTEITTAVNSLTLDADATTIFAAVWNNGIYANSGGPNWVKQGEVTNTLVWRAAGDGSGGPLLAGTESGLNLWQANNWVTVAPAFSSRTRAVLALDVGLYAGQQGQGIIVSRNGGQTWSTMNHGLTITPTIEFYNLQSHGDYLYTVTTSGIWRWPLP